MASDMLCYPGGASRLVERTAGPGPYAAAPADSSVRANIEQQAIEFIVYSLKPWLARWQQTLNRKLLDEKEQRHCTSSSYWNRCYRATVLRRRKPGPWGASGAGTA